MTAKIILSSEPGSAKFTDKVILFDRQEAEVRVTRSSSDETSHTHNSVFDCQVLSKNHAMIGLDHGQFYLKDLGSRNGSFINNFRLNEEKKGFQIFSQDIVRFGSEVMIGKYSGKARCIIARLRIYYSNGTECEERPANDKFFRVKGEGLGHSHSNLFHLDEELSIEEKVDKLEKIVNNKFENGQGMLYDTIAILENRLNRKETENMTLMGIVAKMNGDELLKKSSLNCGHGSENDCQMDPAQDPTDLLQSNVDSVKIIHLERDLEETKFALKFKTEETVMLKEKLKNEAEDRTDEKNIALNNTEKDNKLDSEGESITHFQMKILFKDGWEKIESQNVEFEKPQQLDRDIESNIRKKITSDLTSSIDKELTNGDYNYLKSLLTKENKLTEKFNFEIGRLLNIITEDQETFIKKDQTIFELENSLKDKIRDIESLQQKPNKEQYYEDYNLILRDEINEMANKHLTKVDNLRTEIDKLNKMLFQKDEENKLSLEKQADSRSTCQLLKGKLEEAENIIDRKDIEIKKNKTNSKNKIDAEFTMNQLKKETSDLKISMWQKDSDITKLKDSLKKKENIIDENNAQMDDYMGKYYELKVKNGIDKIELENSLREKQRVINNMKEIMKETEIKMQNNLSEFEILKIEDLSPEHLTERRHANMNIIEEKMDGGSQHLDIEDKTEYRERVFPYCTRRLLEERKYSDFTEAGADVCLPDIVKEDIDRSENLPTRPPRTKCKDRTEYRESGYFEDDQANKNRDAIECEEEHKDANYIAITFEEEQTYENGDLITFEDVQTDEECDEISFEDEKTTENSDAITFEDEQTDEKSDAATFEDEQTDENSDAIAFEEEQAEENSDAMTFHDALSDEEDVSIEDLELDEEIDDRRPRKSDINLDEHKSSRNIKNIGSKILQKVLNVRRL